MRPFRPKECAPAAPDVGMSSSPSPHPVLWNPRLVRLPRPPVRKGPQSPGPSEISVSFPGGRRSAGSLRSPPVLLRVDSRGLRLTTERRGRGAKEARAWRRALCSACLRLACGGGGGVSMRRVPEVPLLLLRDGGPIRNRCRQALPCLRGALPAAREGPEHHPFLAGHARRPEVPRHRVGPRDVDLLRRHCPPR